jgi:DNA-binding NtrC family response regulator
MILLVDDDPRFLQLSESLLARDELVYFAADAENARLLLALLGRGFTVVLVNVELAESSGLELIRDIHWIAPELPVIAIGGEVQTQLLETAREMGAAETIRKPITREWRGILDRVRQGAAAGGK